jgi:hypothetical protein
MGISPGEGFNLHSFRTTIGDPARPYHFLVHIPEIGSDAVMTAMARSTTLPGYELGEAQIAFQGMNINLASPPQFQPWTVNFICDESHELRRLLLNWQQLAYDAGTQFMGHSNQYKSDRLSVAQLTRDNRRTSIYSFVGAFPKSVGEIQVAQDAQGFETFDVTFRYDYFVMPNQIGDNSTNAVNFIRSTRSPQISRGSAPGNGRFKPQ